MPASWSQLATNVVVSKYFRGLQDPQRGVRCPSADLPVAPTPSGSKPHAGQLFR